MEARIFSKVQRLGKIEWSQWPALLAKPHVRSVLGLLGLPRTYRQDRWQQLLDAMRRDKKARGDLLRFVVLDDLGRPGRLEGPDPALLVAAYTELAS